MYAIEKKTLSQLLKKILIWEFRNGVKLFWFYFSQVDICLNVLIGIDARQTQD